MSSYKNELFALCCGRHEVLGKKSHVKQLDQSLITMIIDFLPKVAQFMVYAVHVRQAEHVDTPSVYAQLVESIGTSCVYNKDDRYVLFDVISVVNNKINVEHLGRLIDDNNKTFNKLEIWCDDIIVCSHTEKNMSKQLCVYKFDNITNKYKIHDETTFDFLMSCDMISNYLVTLNYVNIIVCLRQELIFIRINKKTKKICQTIRTNISTRSDRKCIQASIIYDDNNFVILLNDMFEHYQLNGDSCKLIHKHPKGTYMFDPMKQEMIKVQKYNECYHYSDTIKGTTLGFGITYGKNQCYLMVALYDYKKGTFAKCEQHIPDYECYCDCSVSPNTNDINNIILCVQQYHSSNFIDMTHQELKYTHWLGDCLYQGIIGRSY